MPVGSQRHLFEVPEGVAYFNTANMSPLLKRVREAGEDGLARRAAPWAISASDWFSDVERLRTGLADVLGASAEGVGIIPATSYGLAVAARNIVAHPGERVLVLAEEYPSNYYTWERFCQKTGAQLVTVRRQEGQSWASAVVAAIDGRTRVVTVPHVHWTNGALVDLAAVATAAHDAGAVVSVDASQSLGALPLDLARVQPDFVVAVGYKWLLGPFGVGCLYVSEKHREGEPLEENWVNREGSDDFAALVDYKDHYRSGARRFDVGQRTNFGLVPMAIAAVDQLLEWGVARVASSLAAVVDEIATRVAGLGLSVPRPDQRGPHMLGIGLPRSVARGLGERLAQSGVVASVRGDALRIAPHLHVTRGDLDVLLGSLVAAI